MSDEASDQPRPKKKGFFARVKAIPSRFSLPAKCGIVFAIFLVCLVATVWTIFWFDPSNVPWRHSMTIWRMLTIAVLVVVLPFILYRLLRVWLERDLPRFPEIDFAWRVGISELRKHGFAIESIPVFLIVGSADERLEKALMEATGESLTIRGIPDGPATLHWYANAGAVYLFLTDTCRLSGITSALNKREKEATSETASRSLDELLQSSQASQDQSRRLEYVCDLLRQARQPAAPCNGILTLLAVSTVQSTDSAVEEFQRAIKSDMILLQRSLQIRCPVITLVTGMEQAPGFRELVRRVEHSNARSRRFGKGFDLRVPSTTDELALFTVHVAGVFEDWTYRLFLEPGALTRPGNRHLYSLLCRVRSMFQVSLTRILSRGFGIASDPTGDAPLLFSGCYFAATGGTPDRQSFVKGVMDKLLDERDSLEWTQAVQLEDRRYAWLTKGTWVLNVLCLSSIAVMIIRRLFFVH